MFTPKNSLTVFGQKNKQVAEIFREIAVHASYKSHKTEDDALVASVFILFRFDKHYEYTSATFVEVIGLLSSPEGREYDKLLRSLPEDTDYKIAIPEHIKTLGVEFLQRSLKNVRDVVCRKERGKLVSSKSAPAVISGLAASLTESIGISSALATGLAASILVILAQACHKSFCDMTDEQIVEAVKEKIAPKEKI